MWPRSRCVCQALNAGMVGPVGPSWAGVWEAGQGGGTVSSSVTQGGKGFVCRGFEERRCPTAHVPHGPPHTQMPAFST